jgi:hypothetical protein
MQSKITILFIILAACGCKHEVSKSDMQAMQDYPQPLILDFPLTGQQALDGCMELASDLNIDLNNYETKVSGPSTFKRDLEDEQGWVVTFRRKNENKPYQSYNCNVVMKSGNSEIIPVEN